MKKYKIILFLIILLGFSIRFIGSWYGYPYALGHFDEVFSVRQAMSFGATKSLYPIMLMYPPLHSYILFILYGLYFLFGKLFHLFQTPADFAFLYLVKPFNLYFLARLLSIISGSITILLTYLTAKKLYNARVALWSAWLIAMSLTHITYSHWAKPDIFMIFLVMISLFFTSTRNYIWAGFFAGLAISAKYNAVFLIAPFLIAHLLWREKRGLWHYFLMLFVGILLGSPFCLLNRSFLLQEISFDLNMLRFGEPGNINTLPWAWIFMELLKDELVIGLIFLIGVIYCLLKPKREHAILLVYILVFILFAGKSSKASLHYLLTIFPALSILGALVLTEIISFLSRKNKTASSIFIMLILVLTLLKAFDNQKNLLNKDSRIIAKEWIETNIPPHSKIVLFALRYRDLPPLVSQGGEFYSVDFGPRARSIYQDKRLYDLLDKYYSHVKTYRIYKLEKEIPDSEVNISLGGLGFAGNTYLKSVYKQGFRSIKEIKSLGMEFLVISSFLYGIYEGPPPSRNHPLYLLYKRNKEYFEGLMNSKELLLIKEINSGKSIGPNIKIYKIIY